MHACLFQPQSAVQDAAQSRTAARRGTVRAIYHLCSPARRLLPHHSRSTLVGVTVKHPELLPLLGAARTLAWCYYLLDHPRHATHTLTGRSFHMGLLQATSHKVITALMAPINLGRWPLHGAAPGVRASGGIWRWGRPPGQAAPAPGVMCRSHMHCTNTTHPSAIYAPASVAQSSYWELRR
jgi:hypothetical protein